MTQYRIENLLTSAECLTIFDVYVQQNPAKRKYQIHLKSHSGPIYVLLVNKDSDGSSPVVVQVPPPKEDTDVDITEAAAENRSATSRKAAKVVLHT